MTNSAASQLVSIRSKNYSTQQLNKGAFIVVDSFFLTSIVSSLVGISIAGVVMWLIRNGSRGGIEYYGLLRSLHIDLLIFGFFGTVICGFVIQSAPRILGIPPIVSKPLIYFIIAAPFLGITLKYLTSWNSEGSLLMSTGYLFAAIILILRQKLRALRPHSLFVLLSLSSLSIGTFFAQSASQAIALFWLSTGAAILGTAHIFIANILGGGRIHPSTLYIILALTFITSLLLFVDKTNVAAFFGITLSIIYIASCKIYQARLGRPLLRLGFQIGFVWLLVAWVILMFGLDSRDQALHAMALGWGISILYPLSIHICSYLSNNLHLNQQTHIWWLWIWQSVPLSRGLFFEVQSPYLTKAIGSLSTLFLMQWWYTIIKLRINKLK